MGRLLQLKESLVASRLLEYELWTRVHARSLSASVGPLVRDLIARVAFLELVPPVLARALELFAAPIRTLDALHLASLEFLRQQRQTVQLATSDDRMRAAARKLHIPIYPLA
jgi:hypothetical protein